MKELSVIIPIYKTPEELLVRMFRSVQGLPADTEIVCVIDSPGDPCEVIVNKFAANDSRIVVLRNDQNMGETWSRNRALDAISGEFFTCVDADDVIKPEAYVKALKILKEKQYDFCSLGMTGADKKKHESYGDCSLDFDTVVLQVEMSSCGVIVRTEKVREAGLRYPNGLPNNGDYVFVTRLLWSGMRCCAIPDIGYCVVGHPDSSSRSPFTVKRFNSTAKALRLILELLFDKQISKDVLHWYATAALFHQMVEIDCKDYDSVVGMPSKEYLNDEMVSAQLMRKIFRGYLNPLVDFALRQISRNPRWALDHYKLFLLFLKTGVMKCDMPVQLKKFIKRKLAGG